VYLYLVAGALCLGVAVVATMNAVRNGRRATVSRIATIIDYGTQNVVGGASSEASDFIDAEPSQSAFATAAEWLGGLFSGRLVSLSEDEIRDQLIAAGLYTISPRTVIGYRLLATVLLPALVYVAFGVHSLSGVLMVAIAAFAGWILPLTIIQRQARQRVDTIDRSLPDLIDLLCVMVEAGLSFPSSLRMASEQFGPPLSDELRLTLQEQTMGLSVDEALSHMADRADTPAMKAFVRAMSQGEKMGISTGQIMRNLAGEMRNRRRSRAEEKAQKTPVLMLFPLVFLIFPAMFIILMTPAVINLINGFKGT
jgi:tight adherence protein C